MSRKILWVSKAEQLKAFKSPIRADIVDRLTALGPLSVRDLSAAVGKKPTAIYRHLQALEKLGLVLAEETSGGRGRPASVYRAAASLIRLARAPRNPNNRKIMKQIAMSIANNAARGYGAAFDTPDWRLEGPNRNHWFFQIFSAPSPLKLKRMNELLDELAELLWVPDPKPGPLLRVTWLMSPVPPPKPGKRKKR